jgi:hypothetical protein
MNPQIESKIRRIEKTSAWLRAGCTFFLILTPVFFLFITTVLMLGRAGNFQFYDRSIPITELTTQARAVLAVLCGLTAAATIKGLYHIRRLLDNYSRREIFTFDSAAQIRQLGYTGLFWAGLKTAWAFMPLFILKPSSATIMLPFDSFAVALVVIVISWFTEMAAGLREENELTI